MTPQKLRNVKGFNNLLVSTVANDFAQSMSYIVIPLLILANGGGPKLAGLISALAIALSVATNFFSGYVCDSYNPRRVTQLASVGQMLSWIVLAAAQFSGHASFVLITLCCCISAVCSSISAPSEQIILQKIVPEKLYAKANSVTQARQAAAGLLGNPFAGFLFAISHTLTMAVQSILHGLAALLVPKQGSIERDGENATTLFDGMKSGFVFIWRLAPLRSLVILASLVNLPFAMFPLVMIATYEAEGYSSTLIGVYMTMMGIGVLIGSAFAEKLVNRCRPVVIATLCILAFTIMLFATAVAYKMFILSCAIYLFGGLMLPSMNTLIVTYTMKVTPDDQLGRVFAASGVPGMLLMPLGKYLGGALLESHGTTTSLVVAGVVAMVSLLPVLLSAESRRLPVLQTQEEEEPVLESQV